MAWATLLAGHSVFFVGPNDDQELIETGCSVFMESLIGKLSLLAA
jgi:hypothetical protein